MYCDPTGHRETWLILRFSPGDPTRGWGDSIKFYMGRHRPNVHVHVYMVLTDKAIQTI